jgi:hypothetical protein
MAVDIVRATILKGEREFFGTPDLAFHLGRLMGIASLEFPETAHGMWESVAMMYSDEDELWERFVAGWNYAQRVFSF